MRSWRGTRWWSSAVVLFGILVPGLGGSLLAMLHPCPVGMPWLASAAAPPTDGGPHDAHAHHAEGRSSAPEAPSHEHANGETCSCVGACSTSGAPALAAAVTPLIEAPVLAGVDRPGFTVVAARLSARLRELLPPSTAPPAIA